MERVQITLIGAMLALGVQPASGGEITFSYHEASGSGTANVFDGGPPVSGGGTLSDPNGATFLFGAFDDTRPGSLGASTHAQGSSEISIRGDEMTIHVKMTAAYFPSLFGGDNPGGMAEASLFSVIEFVMPMNELDWIYSLWIDQRDPFDGSTSVVFENVTRSETLLSLTATTGFNRRTLVADPGDVLRLTTSMNGAGTMGPGSGKYYLSELGMVLTIPEPATWGLLLFGVAAPLIRRRRRSVGAAPTG